jgi:1,4-alpha-glucan branching enzyme
VQRRIRETDLSQDPAKSDPAPASLSNHAIEAIVKGLHGDPFAVLGPHQVAASSWEVRAMLPRARAVQIVSLQGLAIAPMERHHIDGFFVARFASDHRPEYRLRTETAHRVLTINDPYSFGSVLDMSAFQALRGEGELDKYLGAQIVKHGGVCGVHFCVWAPNARRVSVIADFNDWDGRQNPMRLRYEGGIWELFVPDISTGVHYKFEIVADDDRLLPLKADPLAFAAERPPATASIVHGRPEYDWHDNPWIQKRGLAAPRDRPISIYECHLGSWARVPEDGNRCLTYRELAERLIPYVKDMGFTHIELLPVTEYPFDGSWGYQPVSLFAPTRRFGPPQDFAAFVEAAHAAEVGVILDWVPAHLPNDPHGLGEFDGTHLYEHADPRQGLHRDWGTYIYNYGRREVSAFLISNARFWVERYHLDALRVDAVASMLYLDYSRKPGEWVPNRYGGNENLEAIGFLRRMNETVYSAAPGAFTVAEESTAWPGVSAPTYAGGLGFGFKWNMGWMHDTLRFMQKDPIYRRHHHSDLTFGLLYAFSENFILPLSHDEVVHGKGSLVAKMPGDEWQKFANLRAYLGFMWGHPGKKLLFMGGEFAQGREWNHDSSLDWHLLANPFNVGVQRLVRDLNRIYHALPALYELDCVAAGFEWLVGDDRDNSVVAFSRHGKQDRSLAVVVCNFTPVPRQLYRFGVPLPGFYREAVNTDAADYGGSNAGNLGGVEAAELESHGKSWSLSLTLPPLATLILERV